jgi:Fe-S-cluster containining protein
VPKTRAKTEADAAQGEHFQQFQCLRCGTCCTGPGFVALEVGEADRIAKFLGVTVEEFRATYTRIVGDEEVWLVDGEGNDVPCVFLERPENGPATCRIQSVKPNQCNTFPMKWRSPGATNWCDALLEAKSARKRGKGKSAS